LEKQTFKELEVIIVDNNSTDDSLDKIKRIIKGNLKHIRIRLIALATNSGFAAGNKEGLRLATGEYIALLNADTTPHYKWLEELVHVMDDNPYAGICASKLTACQSDMIDSAGDGCSKALKGFKRGEGRETTSFDKEEFVFGACAGAALYRRKMLEETGFLDEDFFLIYEDTDLNFRAQLAGWKVMYVPTAVVQHKVRSSIGIMSDTAIYYSLRNSELVRIKNVPVYVFFRCLPEFIISIIAEFLYFAIKHNKSRLYFKAKWDALRMLPVMLKKRKAIMKTRKVNDKYLLGMMTPVWQKDFFKAKAKRFLHG